MEPNTRRLTGIDTDALVRTSHDLVVHASVDRVWEVQTDVERWPLWQPPVSSSKRLDAGPLTAGSQFSWSTPIPASDLAPADLLEITSTVQEVVDRRRLLWAGPGSGRFLRVEQGIHLWTFTPVDDGTLVHTEESWSGELVDAHAEPFTAALAASLEGWLQHLKTEAERPLG